MWHTLKSETIGLYSGRGPNLIVSHDARAGVLLPAPPVSQCFPYHVTLPILTQLYGAANSQCFPHHVILPILTQVYGAANSQCFPHHVILPILTPGAANSQRSLLNRKCYRSTFVKASRFFLFVLWLLPASSFPDQMN